MAKPLPDISLSDEEREELHRIIRKSTSPQHKVLRAKIVLLAEKKMSTEAIKKELNISKNTTGKWRKRFSQNRLEGLDDEHRSGKPRTHQSDVRLKIATEACRPPETITHWSTRELAQHLSEQGIKVSHMTVQRVLSAEKIKPHLYEYWLNSTDPDFEAKQTEIIGLYMNPPENALVISVDEKTGLQALGRKHPNKPVKRDSTEKIDQSYGHSNKEIHLIVDNLSVHKHQRVKDWLSERPNYFIHFTPTHASWLNQIELWFSIYARKIVKRGVFDSKDALIEKTLEFIKLYNKNSKPFRWTYTGDPLTI